MRWLLRICCPECSSTYLSGNVLIALSQPCSHIECDTDNARLYDCSHCQTGISKNISETTSRISDRFYSDLNRMKRALPCAGLKPPKSSFPILTSFCGLAFARSSWAYSANSAYASSCENSELALTIIVLQGAINFFRVERELVTESDSYSPSSSRSCVLGIISGALLRGVNLDKESDRTVRSEEAGIFFRSSCTVL